MTLALTFDLLISCAGLVSALADCIAWSILSLFRRLREAVVSALMLPALLWRSGSSRPSSQVDILLSLILLSLGLGLFVLGGTATGPLTRAMLRSAPLEAWAAALCAAGAISIAAIASGSPALLILSNALRTIIYTTITLNLVAWSTGRDLSIFVFGWLFAFSVIKSALIRHEL